MTIDLTSSGNFKPSGFAVVNDFVLSNFKPTPTVTGLYESSGHFKLIPNSQFEVYGSSRSGVTNGPQQSNPLISPNPSGRVLLTSYIDGRGGLVEVYLIDGLGNVSIGGSTNGSAPRPSQLILTRQQQLDDLGVQRRANSSLSADARISQSISNFYNNIGTADPKLTQSTIDSYQREMEDVQQQISLTTDPGLRATLNKRIAELNVEISKKKASQQATSSQTVNTNMYSDIVSDNGRLNAQKAFIKGQYDRLSQELRMTNDVSTRREILEQIEYTAEQSRLLIQAENEFLKNATIRSLQRSGLSKEAATQSAMKSEGNTILSVYSQRFIEAKSELEKENIKKTMDLIIDRYNL